MGGQVVGVSPPDETQGYAGGSAKILLRSNIGVNAELFATGNIIIIIYYFF